LPAPRKYPDELRERIAARLVGPVGMVVDGVQQPGYTRPGLPPLSAVVRIAIATWLDGQRRDGLVDDGRYDQILLPLIREVGSA
jgi:hypothetical protein